MFEILTLVQTGKMRKRMPIVLFGAKYWDEVVNFDALVRAGTISAGDLALFHRTEFGRRGLRADHARPARERDRQTRRGALSALTSITAQRHTDSTRSLTTFRECRRC